MSDTIKLILDAEKLSDTSENEAREQAKNIVDTALREAESEAKKKISQSRLNAAGKINLATKEAQAIIDSAPQHCEGEITALEKLYNAKCDDAVKEIKNLLFS